MVTPLPMVRPEKCQVSATYQHSQWHSDTRYDLMLTVEPQNQSVVSDRDLYIKSVIFLFGVWTRVRVVIFLSGLVIRSVSQISNIIQREVWSLTFGAIFFSIATLITNDKISNVKIWSNDSSGMFQWSWLAWCCCGHVALGIDNLSSYKYATLLHNQLEVAAHYPLPTAQLV